MICGRCEARISKQLPGAQDGFVERQENGLIGGSRGCCQSLNSGNITGYRASPRPARPVFTNPIHLAEKPRTERSDFRKLSTSWKPCGRVADYSLKWIAATE
jgi:hypothetical protein